MMVQWWSEQMIYRNVEPNDINMDKNDSCKSWSYSPYPMCENVHLYPHVRALGGSEVMVKYGSMLGQYAIACCDATELSMFLPQIEGHYAYS